MHIRLIAWIGGSQQNDDKKVERKLKEVLYRSIVSRLHLTPMLRAVTAMAPMARCHCVSLRGKPFQIGAWNGFQLVRPGGECILSVTSVSWENQTGSPSQVELSRQSHGSPERVGRVVGG